MERVPSGVMLTVAELMGGTHRRIEGSRVYDKAGQPIGTVTSLLIDDRSGVILGAVVTGWSRFHTRRVIHSVPWSCLCYDSDLPGFRVQHALAPCGPAPSLCGDETLWPDKHPLPHHTREDWPDPLPWGV